MILPQIYRRLNTALRKRKPDAQMYRSYVSYARGVVYYRAKAGGASRAMDRLPRFAPAL